MKKVLCLVLVVFLSMSMLVGCAPGNKELWDAYVKTSNVKSESADLSFTINVDASNVKDIDLKAALLLINSTKLDINTKTMKDSKGAEKASVGGTLITQQTPYNLDLWVDMDFTDAKNPKFVEIFKIPNNIPNMPKFFDSKYAYIDIVDMQKASDGPQINFDGYKDLMDTNKILDTLTNIDTKNINVDKKVVGVNNEFTVSLDGAVAKSITDQYFDAIFNGPLMKPLETGGTLEQSKQAFDMMSKVLKKINLFGEEGIKSVITVNSDGYFVEEKDTINLNIDIAQIASAFGETADSIGVPNEKFSITINAVTKYSDIDKLTTIDIPQLTNSNSIDFNSFSRIDSFGQPCVLLNGKFVNFEDVSPVIVNDRTMVPMRKIFESLGSTVDYNNGLITAVKGDKTIKHTIGENVIYVDGSQIKMDVESFETNGRTLVPVRFISNALGANVDWSEEIQAVIITLD